MTTTRQPSPPDASTVLHSHLHPRPSWNVDDHVVPTGREETWRFSPVPRFRDLMQAGPVEQPPWRLRLGDAATAQTVSLSEARAFSFDAPVDIVAARAVAGAGNRATLITVAPESEPDAPIVCDLEGAEQSLAGHLLVDIGHHARVTLVLRHRGVAHLAEKVEIHAGEGAHLDVVSVQDWQARAVHGGQVSLLVGRDATVRTIQASIGQGDVRLVERAEFQGPGGSLEQLGLYFVQAGQHVEHRLFIDHSAPRTTSNVDYRGALQGKGAHSVWIGDVLIRAVALDINTYETNKNLMLTEGCQADSVPNLEIETGEIQGAGHSSSTGRFDEEQLFYLKSRGIPEDQAKRLVVEGFFLDIIHRIGIPEIEARLGEALNAQLSSIAGMASESILADDRRPQ